MNPKNLSDKTLIEEITRLLPLVELDSDQRQLAEMLLLVLWERRND